MEPEDETDDKDNVVLPTHVPSRTPSAHDTAVGSSSTMRPERRFADGSGEGTSGYGGDIAGYPGGPSICDLILSYEYHVARDIWNGEDHGTLEVHVRHTTLHR